MRIGIRREDKNVWERRAPLTPGEVGELVKSGVEVFLQPSSIRIFPDEAYKKAGGIINEDLSSCPTILAVKEIPVDFLEPNKAYIFFSHTIKGQKFNMPLLKKLMELRCQLIDYEVITDEKGRRLIFFGRHAGLAGMIDTLWAFGKRLEWEGFQSAFSDVKMAHEYDSLKEAKSRLAEIADKIEKKGIASEMSPLICGFAGYGNVSAGAQEIFDIFPHDEITPSRLIEIDKSKLSGDRLYKVVFKEEDMVEPVDSSMKFGLQDYYDNPEKYRSVFEGYLGHLSILVNCIYWEERYPRLVTLDYLKRSYSGSLNQSLKVIGDISCDIGGSIQCNVKATDPGDPVYVYEPLEERVVDGVEGKGPVIMAVDNLPCELAKESSEFFGEMLAPFVPSLAGADYGVPFDGLDLPIELHRAVILHNGELTPKYEFMKKYL